jgi:hypothetical protein
MAFACLTSRVRICTLSCPFNLLVDAFPVSRRVRGCFLVNNSGEFSFRVEHSKKSFVSEAKTIYSLSVQKVRPSSRPPSPLPLTLARPVLSIASSHVLCSRPADALPLPCYCSFLCSLIILCLQSCSEQRTVRSAIIIALW